MTENSLKGRKILVVDDEPDQLTFIATVFEDNGAEVIECTDGNDVAGLARDEKPSLITLDLGMPGKSGIDVFTELRNDPELGKIPICIVTGRPELRKLIYEMTGVSKPEGYVDKPVNEKDLIRDVRMILELRDRKAAR